MRGFELTTFLLTSLLLSVLVGCSATKPFASKSQKAKDKLLADEMQFDLAQAAEKDGQFARSAEVYRKLSEEKPEVAQLHQRLGIVLTRMGQRPEGLVELERATQLDSANPHILNDLGYACLQMGEIDRATELFRKALAINPQSKRSNNNLALALGYSGDLKESFRVFQNTLTESEALENLGYLAAQSGNSELAVKAYSRALSLEPERKSAGEALIQLALLDRDLSESQSIANDLNQLNDPESKAKPPEIPVRQAAHESTRSRARTKPIARPSASVTVNDTRAASVVIKDLDE